MLFEIKMIPTPNNNRIRLIEQSVDHANFITHLRTTKNDDKVQQISKSFQHH